MDKAKERLDPWADDVDEIQSFLHIQRYQYAVKEVKGVALDVGCGLGYGSRMLSTICNFVVALDHSDPALSYAQRNYHGPEYIKADAQALPFADMSFDSVVALEIVEHVDSGFHLLQEINRVLKNEGILILSTPNVAHLKNRVNRILFKRNPLENQQKNPYHKHEYTPEDITKLLESTGFKIQKKRGQILTFPLVHKLPPQFCVNTGRFLPELSLHLICRARKTGKGKTYLHRKKLLTKMALK